MRTEQNHSRQSSSLLGRSNWYKDVNSVFAMSQTPILRLDFFCLSMAMYNVSSQLFISAFCGNWIEIAYGTSSGAVRVIVHHPETVSSGPQLFQTFLVHRSSVNRVTLSEKQLISGRDR